MPTEIEILNKECDDSKSEYYWEEYNENRMIEQYDEQQRVQNEMPDDDCL